MSSRTRLTNRERFDIESCIVRNGDETDTGWQYHEGMSDAAIAKQFKTTRKTVSNIRNKTFGKLAGRAERVTKIDIVNERIDDLEKRLAVLEKTTGPSAASPPPMRQSWIDRSSGNGILTEESL